MVNQLNSASRAMGCKPRIQKVVGMSPSKAAQKIQQSPNPEVILKGYLDRILSPEIPIDDSESIDYIRWLMAGGNTPEDFTAKVKKYHVNSICGSLWKSEEFAFRCRTCCITPCMSLCSACFARGQHHGHDYQIFRSATGGACDCGNANVMHYSGFCSLHLGERANKDKNPPDDLLRNAKLMAPRIFCRLILHLRHLHHKCESTSSGSEISLGADNFLTMLCELSDMGAAMLRVLTSAVVNAGMYRKLIREWPRDNSEYATYMTESEHLYEEAMSSFKNPEPPPEFKNCPGLQVDLKHKNFLEEILFWMMRYEFPVKLSEFILVMFPDPSYKEALIKAYILHYSRIAMVMLRADKEADYRSLSKRISKINVQWFSNGYLAQKMTLDFFLNQVLVVTLKRSFDSSVRHDAGSSTVSTSEPKHLVVDCKSRFMTESRHWLFVSDLSSVLQFESVALKLMNNKLLVKMLFSVCSYLQGMNVYKKEYDQHIECEEVQADTVSLAELGISSLILPLLVHLKDEATATLMKRLLTSCLDAMERWLQSARTDELLGDRISFHIPLHRLLTILISHAVNVQHVKLSDVMPPDHLIRRLLPYPLHIQAVFREIINKLWVRNGVEFKKLAVNYAHPVSFSIAMDADLAFLQIFGAELPPNEIMKATMEEFKVNEWFQLSENTVPKDKENETDAAIVEGFLEFWAILCVNRTYLGNSRRQNLKNELVNLLCVADQSHSQLTNRLPENIVNENTPEINAILNEISDYEPPGFEQNGIMRDGIYRPKASVWNEFYDPLHTILRMGVNRLDVQDAANRLVEHLKKNKVSSSAKGVWRVYRMPVTCEKFRDPRCMLNGRIFHALVWIVLYKNLHCDYMPENILSLTIYLLELATSVAAEETGDTDQKQAEPIDVTDLDLENWFSSDVLTKNVGTEIRKVRYISNGETDAIEVNESIISLLLKNYSKIALNTVLNINNYDVIVLENRIGDDAAFIEKTLLRIVLLSDMCRKMVQDCHEKLSSSEAESREDNAEKKLLALESRRRIMESITKQRDKFAKENESMLGEDKMDFSETSEGESNRCQNEKHSCSICRKTLNSTKKNPIMLLTQIQFTSVLKHRKSPAGASFAKEHLAEVTLLSEQFDDWSDSVTFGYEDGVYVQSCGHLFDHACLKPIMLNKNEIFCPVCRQTANHMIPIIPNDFSAQSTENESISDFKQSVAVVSEYLEQTKLAVDNSWAFFRDIVNTSLEKFRGCFDNAKLARYNMSERSPCSMLFLMSIARCNLEMELLLRGGSLVVQPSPKDSFLVTNNSCTLPLLRFLRIGAHTSKLKRDVALKLWKQLIGSSSHKRKRKCFVPILLRDPIAVLLHLILILPFDFQKAHFRQIVKLLYTLVNFQAAIRLSYHLTKEQRDYFRRGQDETNNNKKNCCYDTVMRKTVEMLDSVIEGEICTQEVQPKLPDLSLPFLRVASMLQNHMYGDPLPEIVNVDEEHRSLFAYLQLTDEISLAESEFITEWFSELRKLAVKNTRSSKVPIYKMLSSGSMDVWCPPKLISLPKDFNDLFLAYKDKPCTECKKRNDQISLCLVCGTLLCLKGKCCTRNGVLESIRHADQCSAGIGIYLTVSKSNVVIVRNRAGHIWGSMYLNAYGEEDRDFIRGNPLFLSKERYHQLEHEWLSHGLNRPRST